MHELTRLAFHRPARLRPPQLPEEKLILPAPPEVQPGQLGATWLNIALPLLSSVGMAAYMITFGRPMLIIIGVLFVLVAIGTTVAMRMQMRNAHRQGNRRQRLRYRAHLSNARAQAREIAAAQRMRAALVHPEPNRLWAVAANYEQVWERRPSDPDFLRVRIGVGEAELTTPIQIGNRLDPLGDYDWDSLRAAQRLVTRMGRVAGQPAVLDLANCGVLSVLGPAEERAALVRSMLSQIAVLHAPDDVCIALERSGPGQWEWVKWLPHAIEAEALGPAGIATLVSADPGGLADFLEGELLHRQELAAVRRGYLGNDPAPPARLVVVFTGFAPVSEWGRSALLRSLLGSAGPQTGITLVFMAERESDEPGRVDLRLRLAGDGSVQIEGQQSLVESAVEQCRADLMDLVLAELIARQLAPLRLTDEHDQVLARTISLTEMLLGGDPAAVDITAGWAASIGDRLLRVPIGNDAEGQPVILDIKESAQRGFGPHGLIVGATGSGKSELLRTLVTGLALTHPPELVSFVLIDFKGGATFAPMTDLPHVAGLITNLADDAVMIDRVQAALMGEQQRRQQLLRAAGNLDSIREYQRRQSAGLPGPDGAPLQPLPYLMIIVDEFSELLSGRPEFTDLFVQIGRVGRSLGLHLLLATQRLEEGRLRGLDSHLSYRICLRTFSSAESRTVIGTTDAYRLPSIPGSAYLKVDESIYQRFRVAHVSAPYRSATDSPDEDVVGSAVVQFDADRGEAWEEAPAPAASIEATGPTELEAVVGQLKRIGRPAHQVWLPPLPAAIPLDYLTGTPVLRPGRGLVGRLWPNQGNLTVPIGVLDLPLQQEQRPLQMDFAGPHGHLALVGAPQTGRSTALRTLMLAGMLTHTPEEMQFICIDFGGGSLHPYAVAPHVSCVAGRTDLPLVRRSFAEIRALIQEREVLFRELGVESMADFRARRSAGRLPDELRAADVFLLIDNWGGLRGEFEEADAEVAEIAARGLGVGVHVVLAASRWNEMRPALRDSIGTRIELRLNDPTESEVNRRLAARMARAVPGRGIVAPEYHFHLALPRVDGQETAAGGYEAQEATLSAITAAWTGPVAPPVRMLPDRVSLARVRELAQDARGVPIGLAEADLAPVLVDLAHGDPHFLVFGDTGSGKTSFLRTFIHGLAATASPWDVRVILIDYRRALLGEVPPDYLGAYAPDQTAAQVYVEQLCSRSAERLPPPGITPAELAARSWWEGPELYLVIDDGDLVSGRAASPLLPLLEYLPHAPDIGLHIVLARRISGLGRSTFSDPLLTRIQELGCAGLVLSGDHREGTVLGTVRAELRPPRRGMLVRRGQPAELIQVAYGEPGLGDPAAAPSASAALR